MECPICYDDDSKSMKVLPCKHAFCHACYRKFSHAPTYKCPLCRAKYNNPKVKPRRQSHLLLWGLGFSLGGLSV